MSEMVERVAKAICRAHFDRKPWYGACLKEERLDFVQEREWKTFEPAARDVLARMREPTEAMAEAPAAHDLSSSDTTLVWRRMIDAALTPSR